MITSEYQIIGLTWVLCCGSVGAARQFTLATPLGESAMRQLNFIGTRKLEWREVPEPELEASTDALIRPIAVAACDGDVAIIRGDLPLPGPFPFGHAFAAEVAALGDGVQGFEVGQHVVLPVQISCGLCQSCGRGLTAHCDTVAQPAAWGLGAFGGNWPGAFADLLRVPYAQHLMVPLPTSVTARAACDTGDNVADAWRSVAPQLEEQPGAEVLIFGRGGIGLYAIEIALALGAESVDYVDPDRSHLETAESLGARSIEPQGDLRRGGYAITVDATMTEVGLQRALRATAPEGACTSTFPSFDCTVSFMELWKKGIRFRTGVANARAHLPDVLLLLEEKRIDPTLVQTEVVAWDDAALALADPSTKPVFVREPSFPVEARTVT